MLDLRTTLQNTGLRITPQREAVYAALCATTAHPTAEELYFTVREQAPAISLATVYNTLEMLVDCGLAIKLAGDRSSRYDATCAPHAHARCVSCGAVTDLLSENIPALLDCLSLPEGFSPRATTVEIEGVCSRCGVKETNHV